MRAPSSLAAFLLASALATSLAPAAFAHGGTVVPPPEPPRFPPWLKPDPYSPRPAPPTRPPVPTPPRGGTTPPAPPWHPGMPPTTPPSGPPLQPTGRGPGSPTTGSPPPPEPTPPLPSTPTTPPTGAGAGLDGPPAPPSRGAGPARRGRRVGEAGGIGWIDWWDANADALRREGLGPVITTEASGDPVALELEALRTRRERLIPLLRRAADGALGADHDLVASAFLALARTTGDVEDVERLLRALADDATPNLERESAALALGYLRRTRRVDAFEGKLLDRVRAALFDAIDDDGIHVRCRCFAAFALGLLGDQPGEDDAFSRDGRLVVRGIWSRLVDDRPGVETGVALLVALSLQPPAGVPGAVRDGLRTLATTGRLGRRPRGPLVEAHAALALARLAGGDSSGVFLAMLKGGNRDPLARRASVLAIGVAAPALDAVQRAAAEAELLSQARRGDPETCGIAVLTAGRLLALDLAEDCEILAPGPSDCQERLLDFAEHGDAGIRPFAALGLGLACRPPVGRDASLPHGRLREKALPLLRRVLGGDDLSAESRGAFAIGAGLARDDAALPLLARLAADRTVDDGLRAHACAGLGLLGRSTREVLTVLRDVLSPRSADELRREAARALGALGDRGAVPQLAAELGSDAPDHVRARAAVALGALRDLRSVEGLSTLVLDAKAGDLTRALACACLGLVGDPERVPSTARLAVDSNFLVRTDALLEALSIL